MKRRSNKAQELLDELAHDYNTTFKELDNIIHHMTVQYEMLCELMKGVE